jgi:hypothetical protein
MSELAQRHALVARPDFLAAIRSAVRERIPFAVGRNRDARHWMAYPLALQAGETGLRLKAFETALKFHCLKQNGIFPTETDFILHFNDAFVRDLRQLDFYGLKAVGTEAAMLAAYRIPAQLVDWQQLHPDRSLVSRPDNCYLPSFAGQRLLLVSPIANLLAERANQSTFEAVWAKIGKTWFHPAQVTPLEIPFAMALATRQRFPTVLDLLDDTMARIAAERFDVALVGASGLGIPIAARIKSMGKVAISIGSDLQILFGVRGRRWRERESWRQRFFTDAWIDVPPAYCFPEKDEMVEGGAYW